MVAVLNIVVLSMQSVLLQEYQPSFDKVRPIVHIKCPIGKQMVVGNKVRMTANSAPAGQTPSFQILCQTSWHLCIAHNYGQ